MTALISVKEVRKTYSQGQVQVNALASVSLEVSRGDFLCLCGPSGSGKTTLLNLIGGLDLPSSGEIILDGKHMENLSRAELAEERLKYIGFVFQAYNLIPVLSAQENVEFVMQLQGVSKTERTERSIKLLAEVGLAGMEHRRPGELSGGQQQRVAVARAIVGNPKLVLADEPTANLDSKTAETLLDIMRKMNDQHGVTFIFSTHDQRVMNHAKRLVHLKDGAIVSDERR